MASEELVVRLNHRGYKNWLKAGRCLLILQEGLHPFTDHHMRHFHGDLLRSSTLLQNTCSASCKPKANKVFTASMVSGCFRYVADVSQDNTLSTWQPVSSCSSEEQQMLEALLRVCSEWKNVILRHHRQPDSTINWDNCFPPNWSKEHWEVAKAYMPRGQASKHRAHQCDASALLNLISHCSIFAVDPKVVREVIRSRNELMHSSEFSMSNDWMRHFHANLKLFMQNISQDERMETVALKIDEMLTLDFLICVPGLDILDGLQVNSVSSVGQAGVSVDIIGQWEAELLQEMLQECFHTAVEDGDTNTMDIEQVKKLRGFLKANKDLSNKFSTELQVINSLNISG